MKKILWFIMFTLVIVACGTNKVSTGKYAGGKVMKNAFESVFTKSQFDSICIVDTLPVDLEFWHKLYYRDYETRQPKTEYLFIKRLGKQESIYRLEPTDDSKYKITKRITFD